MAASALCGSTPDYSSCNTDTLRACLTLEEIRILGSALTRLYGGFFKLLENNLQTLQGYGLGK